jgi:hypothetical protein
MTDRNQKEHQRVVIIQPHSLFNLIKQCNQQPTSHPLTSAKTLFYQSTLLCFVQFAWKSSTTPISGNQSLIFMIALIIANIYSQNGHMLCHEHMMQILHSSRPRCPTCRTAIRETRISRSLYAKEKVGAFNFKLRLFTELYICRLTILRFAAFMSGNQIIHALGQVPFQLFRPI